MDKKTEKNREIDLKRVFAALLKRAWLIAVVSVVCAVLVFVCTLLFVTPKYEASTKFYVNNSSISIGGISASISSSDLLTSRGLVDSYIVILKTRETINDVIEYSGVDRSYGEVLRMISAVAVDETEIFEVTVSSPDAEEAEKIANAIGYILPKRIALLIEGTSAKVVEAAIVPTSPSSPSYVKNAVIGFMVAFLLSVGFVSLREIMDITIRSAEDITGMAEYPILASVPDMTAPTKGSTAYGYGRDREKNDLLKNASKQPGLIGPDIGFAASEAYKLLRTKLQFSFADGDGCRVIGISSSLSGEGKSLTAINLAYTLSELGKRVILLDCDMRRPTLAEKLKIQKKPGLSSYLTGQSDLASLVQYCSIKNDEKAFHVVSAGQNPPNPMELLSSARMDSVINTLRKHYDYVILDLPPQSEVGDALAVSSKIDGMLLVVRQNYCNRVVLNETLHQFEFMNTRLLGVVLNATVESEGKYGKYGGSYYKRYSTPREKAATNDVDRHEPDKVSADTQ